jgi:hypothetical protein
MIRQIQKIPVFNYVGQSSQNSSFYTENDEQNKQSPKASNQITRCAIKADDFSQRDLFNKSQTNIRNYKKHFRQQNAVRELDLIKISARIK